MSGNPNNFPRAGEHNPVTRSHLDMLEAQRPEPNNSLDYTIGGEIEQAVHEETEADRLRALSSGTERLRQVSDGAQTAHVFATLDGHAKVQFGTVRQAEKTYADMQREAAAHARSQQRDRER